MYFAWLGYYTTSMLYPAVIGFVLWMLTESDQVRGEKLLWRKTFETGPPPPPPLGGLFQTSRDICCVVFALFNVVWATLFLERWKRREAELAYKWGTLDPPPESLEEPRPQFRVGGSTFRSSVVLFLLFSLGCLTLALCRDRE